jgi:hypothetical protein
MIDELAKRIAWFPGAENRARCFNHIIALAAKSLIRQFDVPKAQADVELDKAEKELRDLAKGIDIENEIAEGEVEMPDDDEGQENGDGWVDEVAALSIADREELEANIRPIRLVLVKVSGFFFVSSCHWTYANVIIAS